MSSRVLCPRLDFDVNWLVRLVSHPIDNLEAKVKKAVDRLRYLLTMDAYARPYVIQMFARTLNVLLSGGRLNSTLRTKIRQAQFKLVGIIKTQNKDNIGDLLKKNENVLKLAKQEKESNNDPDE